MTPNPYYGSNILTFFMTLVSRLLTWLSDGTEFELVSDEIQILVLLAVGASAALVGCFLMLRRMTMLANSLSHTILLGIVTAFLVTRYFWAADGHAHEHSMINLEVMVIAAILTGILTTFLTEMLAKHFGLQEDASTGLVFTTLFAIGVLLLTIYSRNAHVGSEVVMGNVDGLRTSDIGVAWWVLLVNVLLFTVFFKEYQLTTFDKRLAQALGFSTNFFNYLLMIQASATAIGAFRAVGVLMVLALITAPALTARLLTDSLKHMLLISVAFAGICSLTGVALARHLLSVHRIALSTGGLVVCVLTLGYITAVLFAPGKGLVAQYQQKRQLRNSQSTH